MILHNCYSVLFVETHSGMSLEINWIQSDSESVDIEMPLGRIRADSTYSHCKLEGDRLLETKSLVYRLFYVKRFFAGWSDPSANIFSSSKYFISGILLWHRECPRKYWKWLEFKLNNVMRLIGRIRADNTHTHCSIAEI